MNPPDYWFAYVERMSVVGDVIIKFNQKVDTKNFTLANINRTSLNLYLDYTVTRAQEDYRGEDFNFTWEAVELGSDFIHIKCDFKKPFSISQDVRFDRLIVHFKKVPMFFDVEKYKMVQGRRLQDLSVDQVTSMTSASSATRPAGIGSSNVDLFKNYTTLSAIVPRQIKKDDEGKIGLARLLNFLLAIFLFGSICYCFCMRISSEKFLYIINELQLIFHLPLM